MKSEDFNLKSIREKFRANGVFYTPPEQAEMLKQYAPDNLTDVYDPTCGRGGLLQVYGDDVIKYGQDIDAEAVEDCKKLWPDGNFITGDVLSQPAFTDKRFKFIVANPPFSVSYNEPTQIEMAGDFRWRDMPCAAPKSKADWMFIQHCLSMLTDDGVLALIESPGVLYRGNREAKIRKWVVEQNLIDRIETIPAKTFVDTNIQTVLIVFRKGRNKEDKIKVVDNEHKIDGEVTFEKLKKHSNDAITPNQLFPTEIEIPKEQLDPMYGKNLNDQIENNAIDQVIHTLEYAKMIRTIDPQIISYNNSLETFVDKLQTAIKDWSEKNGNDNTRNRGGIQQ